MEVAGRRRVRGPWASAIGRCLVSEACLDTASEPPRVLPCNKTVVVFV